MSFQKLDPKEFREDIFTQMAQNWFLLTAGSMDRCNTMTAAWGGLGVLWKKNVATVYVRKSRYTREFMDEGDFFTLSFFGTSKREALNLCGSRSGRDLDKIKETGLTKRLFDGGVAFEEAEMVLSCRKLFRQELSPEYFLDPSIGENYSGKDAGDYHIMYIGEILGIYQK